MLQVLGQHNSAILLVAVQIHIATTRLISIRGSNDEAQRAAAFWHGTHPCSVAGACIRVVYAINMQREASDSDSLSRESIIELSPRQSQQSRLLTAH
eukprot:12480-Heterococcus_DN1.PRE.2